MVYLYGLTILFSFFVSWIFQTPAIGIMIGSLLYLLIRFLRSFYLYCRYNQWELNRY